MCDIVTEAEDSDQVKSSGKSPLVFEDHTFVPRPSPSAVSLFMCGEPSETDHHAFNQQLVM